MPALFRQQAVDAQKQRLHGEVSLAQPLSIYVTTMILLSIVVAIIVFLSLSQYSRKETVHGYLTPDKGIIKTFSYRSGHVERLHVNEGDNVNKGSPLATVVLNRSMPSGKELSESIITELKQQLTLLSNEASTNRVMHTKEASRLTTAISDYRQSLRVRVNLDKLLMEKLALQLQQQAQHDALYKEGYLSIIDYQSQQEKLIKVKQEVEHLKSEQLEQQSLLNNAQSELAILPNLYALKQADLARRQSELQGQIQEAENNYRHVIRATEAGTVTSIQVSEGEFIVTNRPLMSIIPQGAQLVAELLLPTRSAGFIKLGDKARLRFDAFPYQRFGFMQSHVFQIDKSLLLEGEAIVPITLTEPVYRIRSQLSDQKMQAYGDAFQLKSGMLLEADIVLDSRSLLDWLLDPIYSLQGRIN
jgi:membrane fusion protein